MIHIPTASFVLIVGYLSATICLAQSPETGKASPAPDADLKREMEYSVQNMERYRAEIDALIRGVPTLEARQRALTLPGDPLKGLTNPASRAEHPPPGRNQSTLMVFLTLSMPDEALAGWLDQTARAGGVTVIRGLHGDRLSSTLRRIGDLQEKAPATRQRGGVSIDPSAFNRFGVSAAPTVIVSASALPACTSRGCTDDPAPPHDRIAGNITLERALRLLATEGNAAPRVAERHLELLEKGD